MSHRRRTRSRPFKARPLGFVLWGIAIAFGLGGIIEGQAKGFGFWTIMFGCFAWFSFHPKRLVPFVRQKDGMLRKMTAEEARTYHATKAEDTAQPISSAKGLGLIALGVAMGAVLIVVMSFFWAWVNGYYDA